jgi:ribosome production factor 2
MLPKKAKTHKGKMYLDSLLPKLVEDPKQALFINTNNSNDIMRMILNDLFISRREFSKKLSKKENIHNVDENKADLEYLCNKNNTAFFTFTNDTKKKPLDITFGIIFNNQILDSFEFEVTNYIPIEYFSKDIQISSQMKPVIIFQGEIFETEYSYDRLKNFFVDYFKQIDIETTTISDLRRIIIISCNSGTDKIIKIRNYQVNGNIKKGNLDNLELTEIGPSLNLKERHFNLADDETYKNSRKQPKALKPKKEKNIETNLLGVKRGRIHMQKQNLNAVALKKYRKILGKKEKIGNKKK